MPSHNAQRPDRHADVALIGRGRKNLAIAAELGMSVRTVETHRKNLTKKLGVAGAALVRRAALYVPPASAAMARQGRVADDERP